MRRKLKEKENSRETFTGEFEKYGWKTGYTYPERTILLLNIKSENGENVADHLWFNLTKGFAELGELKKGDLIRFKARVKRYTKGYKGYREDIYKPIETDYKLSHPSKVEKI